jgi:predicted small secreted protein
MKKRSVVTIVLVAALLAACATHRPPAGADGRVPGSDDEAGSVAANILYVPGRGLLCGTSGLMAGVVMLVTFGQAYDSASELLHGACSGPWFLGPSEIRQAVP